MRSTTTDAKPVRVIAMLLIAAGTLMILAGGAVGVVVREQLVAENITIPGDAVAFAGNQVDGPLDALIQADTIKGHVLEMTGGSTYADLDESNPIRPAVLEGSMLRASLFTSVMAYGVAALVAGMGLLQILIGVAVRKLVPVEASAPLVREPVAV